MIQKPQWTPRLGVHFFISVHTSQVNLFWLTLKNQPFLVDTSEAFPVKLTQHLMELNISFTLNKK